MNAPNKADLAPLIEAGGPITLVNGGTYTLSRTVTPGAACVINGGGSTINFTVSPGASSNVTVYKPNFSIDNVTINGATTAFRIYSTNASFTNVTFNYPMTAVQTDLGAAAISMVNCVITKSKKVGVYITCSGSITGGSIGPSDIEYSIRFEINSNNVKLSGFTVSNCVITNPHTSDKDAVGIRVGDGVQFRGCTITGDIRIGQEPKPNNSTPGQFCANFLIDSCTILGIVDAVSGIEVYNGCTGTISNTTITATYPISIGADSIVTVSNNIHNVPPTNTTTHNLIDISSQGKWTEAGTKTITNGVAVTTVAKPVTTVTVAPVTNTTVNASPNNAVTINPTVDVSVAAPLTTTPSPTDFLDKTLLGGSTLTSTVIVAVIGAFAYVIIFKYFGSK